MCIDETSKIKLLFQADKLLVTRYRMMDWDGDGIVGGYDEYGSWAGEKVGEYNIDGKKEYDRKGYFDDPWYLAIFTAWLDDWYLGGDIDYASAEAETTYGICGIKVWINKGEIIANDPLGSEKNQIEQGGIR